jgi:hypothetical protein
MDLREPPDVACLVTAMRLEHRAEDILPTTYSVVTKDFAYRLYAVRREADDDCDLEEHRDRSGRLAVGLYWFSSPRAAVAWIRRDISARSVM